MAFDARKEMRGEFKDIYVNMREIKSTFVGFSCKYLSCDGRKDCLHVQGLAWAWYGRKEAYIGYRRA